MRNKKLIPFEVIEKAVAGEPEAVDAVLRHKNCVVWILRMGRRGMDAKLGGYVPV